MIRFKPDMHAHYKHSAVECSGILNSTYMMQLSLLLTRITAAMVLLANTSEWTKGSKNADFTG